MKNQLVLIAKVFISATILIVVIRFFDIRILESLKQVKNYNYLLLSFFIPCFINPVISNNRWKLFLSVQGVRKSFMSLVKISFVSLFLGLLLPATSGSDAIRIYYIEKNNKVYRGAGSASVIMERLLGFILLTFLGSIGSIISIFFGVSYLLFLSIFAVHVFLLLIYITLKNQTLYKKFSSLKMGNKKAIRILQFIDDSYKALVQFKFDKIIFTSILLILLFQLSTIICASLIFKAFNINVSFYYHLALMPVIQVLSIIPISISGFGLREGGFVFFYGLIGVDGSISLLVSLLYYTILVLTPALIGMIFYITDNKYKIAREELPK